MRRALAALTAIFVFVAVAAIMLKLAPGPLKDADYLVIGSVATLVGLLTLFLFLKSSNAFFKKRKK